MIELVDFDNGENARRQVQFGDEVTGNAAVAAAAATATTTASIFCLMPTLMLVTQVNQTNEFGGKPQEVDHYVLLTLQVVEIMLSDIQSVQEVEIDVVGDLRVSGIIT